MENKSVVIIPSDPLVSYDEKGTSLTLKSVFNPNDYFAKVYIVSPKEKEDFVWQGFEVKAVNNSSHYRKIIKNISPSFIRVYGAYWNCSYAIFNRVLEIPIVVSIHDSRDKFIHNSIQFADHIIAVSSHLKEILIKRKVNSKLITVIGNRIDYNKFYPLKRTQKLSEIVMCEISFNKTILHIGRKSEEKNLDVLITALKFLNEEVGIIAIGQGPKVAFLNLAQKLNVSSRLVLLDKVENENLNLWYNASDVFCVPSKSEGFGVVFLEANVAGCKIVASNIRPINEIIPCQYEGVYLIDDYENPKKLAQILEKALSSPKLSNFKLREINRMVYSYNEVGKKEIAVYENLIAFNSKNNSIEYIISKSEYYIKVLLRKISMKIRRTNRRIWKKLHI